MTFPLWYFLIPYAVVLLGTGIFMFFNIYHIAKFGIESFTTTVVLLFYVLMYLGVLVFSAALIGAYNWSATVALSDVLPFVGTNVHLSL